MARPRSWATWIKVYHQQITQIETYVTPEGPPAYASGRRPVHPTPSPPPDFLGDAPRAQFLQTVAPKDRRSREDLMKITNTYWTGIENNTGDAPPLFAQDCKRYENNEQTSGLTAPPGEPPGTRDFSCIDAFANGYYHEDTRLRNRRILAVDVEHQLVYGSVYFDHDAAVRTYQLKDGRTVNVKEPAEWTWATHELFQIDKDGKISQIEAIEIGTPYGMRPYSGAGFRMDSPQAIKDGFKEY